MRRWSVVLVAALAGCATRIEDLGPIPCPSSDGQCFLGTCVAGACRQSCEAGAGSGCRTGESCVRVQDGGFCYRPCANDADCPGSLRCAEGVCEVTKSPGGCAADLACARGDTCCRGRCVSLTTSSNCGSCGVACTYPRSECVAGSCVCPGGKSDCSGDCHDLKTDVYNCGVCNRSCGGVDGFGLTSFFCDAGQCQCRGGEAFCSGTCIDVRADPKNCGQCGQACASGGTCDAGACGCPAGKTDCGGACLDLKSSAANCNACGNACKPGAVCTAGVCGCPAGTADCGLTCADLNSDPQNCRVCATTCPAGNICSSGTCLCPEANKCGTASSCFDFKTDANQCGACGHGCLGAGCAGGYCQPVVVVSNGATVRQIAVDLQFVYWAEQSTGLVKRRPLDGGTDQILFTGQSKVRALAVDSTRVFWGTAGAPVSGVQLAAKAGGAATTVTANATFDPNRLTVVGDHVYFTYFPTAGGHELRQVQTDGGGLSGAMVVDLGANANGIAADATRIYVAGTESGQVQGIYKTSTSGADFGLLVSGQTGLSSLGTENGYLYWTTGDGGEVRRLLLDGGTPATVYKTSGQVLDLALDSKYFYWREGETTILRAAR